MWTDKDVIERTFEHACPQHVQHCRGATGLGFRIQASGFRL
jgi:hypothetical protein